MKNRFNINISLDSLKVFEVAARHMSFSKAADELNVTQAAVSLRIRTLEERLTYPLFIRNGRALSLSHKGERLFNRTSAALDYLAAELEMLSPDQDSISSNVSISASASVSQLWLANGLRTFAEINQDIQVRMNTTDSLSQLETSSDDLVILYCRGAHPNWSLSLLFKEELVPVASPKLLKLAGLDADPQNLTADDLAMLDCYDYARFNAHWFTLRNWFETMNPNGIQPKMKVIYSNYSMTIDAALAGHGIALGSRNLLANQLSAGILVELTKSVHFTGYDYYLGVPHHSSMSGNARALHNHLCPTA